MNSTNIILPKIIKILFDEPQNQQYFENIVHDITDDAKESNVNVSRKEIAREIKYSLKVAIDLGLVAAKDQNMFKLQFNPRAKHLKKSTAASDDPGPNRFSKKQPRRQCYVTSIVEDSDSALSLNFDHVSVANILQSPKLSRRPRAKRPLPRQSGRPYRIGY